MGATTSYEFSVKDNKIAKIAKALVHPAKIAILTPLTKRQTFFCDAIIDEFPVSQHLKQLKEAGWSTGEVEDANEWKAALIKSAI